MKNMLKNFAKILIICYKGPNSIIIIITIIIINT